MKRALWVVQIVLAIGFAYSGWLKAFQQETAQTSWSWMADVPAELVTFIGIVELLGVIGLIVPRATMILPMLTPIAAIGLAVVVVSGGVFHLMRGEVGDVGINLMFLSLSLFVAVGRLKEAAMAKRTSPRH